MAHLIALAYAFVSELYRLEISVWFLTACLRAVGEPIIDRGAILGIESSLLPHASSIHTTSAPPLLNSWMLMYERTL